ncbi:unnamed protein product [Aspergillus oryzae]|uniref:Acyl-protein thioesterase 1 n=1 Tax=Aspergillus oryzae var. brunneus TaxID=332754 RepID=A0ABQ6KPR9_ASPOZ|nr:unnamed protein product [Aspergillus oryzae]GMF93565.1 unnamed protein product [Aspergillus oryzae]GMG14308.1 unnamed protein product [Aspergillus oryzae]GMG43981.1 unnamed protein product [Aspergillus oryzae var. brunneus]
MVWATGLVPMPVRMGLAQNWRRRGLFEEVTFIFPNAPMIPITVVCKLCSWVRDNGLIIGSAYYRILVCQCLDEAIRSQDEPGILRSREYFNTLIKEQIDQGINPSRIVLGGFSQGGAMSVFTGVTNKEKLGGVFGLSCYLLLSDRIKNQIPEDWPNKKTPFFLAHGTDDDVVKYEFGKTSSKLLQDLGLENVQFNSYS